ncbi:fasciclin [Anopheles darlingi]|uniref:Fasciclin n=1 Tax=Anopheles darlingi TaxID=43151 RepID=W5JA79_ANODA|nr:fasciclin [Anopheles darlingi]
MKDVPACPEKSEKKATPNSPTRERMLAISSWKPAKSVKRNDNSRSEHTPGSNNLKTSSTSRNDNDDDDDDANSNSILRCVASAIVSYLVLAITSTGHQDELESIQCFRGITWRGLLTPALGQTPHIETVPAAKTYYRAREKNVDLLCRSDKPIDRCLVRIPGFPDAPEADGYDVSVGLPNGVSYFGGSLARGECGVRLASIRPERIGKFVCVLEIGGQRHEATIEYAIQIEPQPSVLKISKQTAFIDGGIRANQLVKARCVSRRGLPAANLTWSLDNGPLDAALIQPLETSEELVDGQPLQTVQQEVHIYVTPQDNGKTLVCETQHMALGKKSQRIILPLNVKFPPEAIPHIRIAELPESGSATVNITIHANPQPTTRWRVNGRLLNEGETVDMYQAFIPRQTGPSEYAVLLKNNDCTLERASLFTLEASNALGTQTYVIRALKVDDEGESSLQDNSVVDDNSGGGSAFWLISVWTFFCSVIATRLL